MRGAMGSLVRRALLPVVALAVALGVPSCRGVGGRAARGIRIEQVVQAARLGSAGASVTLRIRNGSRRELCFEEARFEFYLDGAPVAEFRLHEPVRIPERTTVDCRSLWRLRTEDPMAYYALGRRLRSGDTERIGISAHIEGRSGRYPVNFSCQRMPVSDFLDIFGLSINDIENFLE